MKVAAVPLVILAVLLAIFYWIFKGKSASEQAPPPSALAMAERVELKTSDNVSIVGDYYPSAGGAGSTSAKGLLLLHMMPADRSSWKTFAEKMQAAGWHVLAIDLRGHGESQGGLDGYKNFSDAEHQASRFDVDTGVEFLKSTLRQSSGQEGVMYLGGASIGANLALQRLAEHPQAKGAFLLSPSLDYRGVKTEPSAKSLKPGQAVYYIASRDDQYSADTIQTLFDLTPSGVHKEIKFFETAGHGTTIFEREPAFMDELVEWLGRQ